jgi:hypothetical protein
MGIRYQELEAGLSRSFNKNIKLSLYITNEALRHEGLWGVDV